ncbi:multisubunit Na+/H+ antiporter MnhF subunit [Streptomyces sp. B3I7]|uniref:MrpF/PhaF family protein n=1 Tax=Streptomyces sp. B3I7 TaxID=3042269 RepID=UPI0027878129|nr:MrpF/PhaF family protein [Streptomyces sp. B3I7]MDQ0809324.1 multisubunit Na+/H+ antiporter MnhF subunit [Streptomyces sp. B3I7]
MNGWTTTATVALAGGLGATLWGAATGPLRRRVVAQNLASAVTTPALLLLAQGYGRPAYVDLALVLALLGPVGTLVFARLLADELAGGGQSPGGRGPTLAVAAYGAVVVVVLCAVTGPSRAMLKLLVVGVLLVAGNLIASRALSGGFGTAGASTGKNAGQGRESNGRG